ARVTASLAVRRAFGAEVRVDRLDVEPLVHRVLGAHDDREIVATASLCTPCAAVTAPNLALDHDVGELGLEVRRECRDRREAGEIASRVKDLGLVGEVTEGLKSRPAPGLDRYDRPQAVLAGQVELRVPPL